MKTPNFASVGKSTDRIPVRLSYKIVELFSEGLYASPNKAIEELVVNAFDAGAQHVQLLLSTDLRRQDASIVVIDDGEGMNGTGLKSHWLIGTSNKRALTKLPRSRQQIGKFGIGKLATYVLAGRLTHITKSNGKYFSASMDYTAIAPEPASEVEPQSVINIPLRNLTEAEAKAALHEWVSTPAFKKAGIKLFGKGASSSWTVAIMSSLKPKVQELKLGTLNWVLRTALPLRPDFGVWLNDEKLVPSKQEKGLLKRWVLGKDIIDLPKPAPKNITKSEVKGSGPTSDHQFGLEVPGLGRVTGYVEAYKDLLTGKSDEIGRSYGFFVYVFDRLVNVSDGHFGISPDELRHGTFGRFRLVIHINSLDDGLRSNRESISEGPLLTAAQNVLRGIFNFIRPTIERYEAGELPGARLARKLAASPASLSRRPIVDLARAVAAGKRNSRYLVVPKFTNDAERDALLELLEKRATDGDNFIADLVIDYDASPSDGIARYKIESGVLALNARHPFIAVFYDDFTGRSAEPLELLAMAEVLNEAHLYSIGVHENPANEFLSARDQLLRYVANQSGRQSAFAIALALREARNDSTKLEDKLCAAFTSLGFDVTPMGGKGKPDGVAAALLSADAKGQPRGYSVSLDAKSKEQDKGKVAAGTVKISTIARHRDDYNCQHALVVGRAFPTTAGAKSALAQEIARDRQHSTDSGEPRSITLITIDDLAKLVELRPPKQIGLLELRGLFGCSLPSEAADWVESLRTKKVPKAPYAKIVNTIEHLQKTRKKAQVKYAALAVELSHLTPPVTYETEEELANVCKALAQMAPGAIYATSDSVELDQSAKNVVAAIDAATRKWVGEQ